MPHIFEVAELTAAVKDVLESQFPFVWVRGEVGEVSRPPSGHMYFTLKDNRARLSVVWFKGNRRSVKPGGVDPLTGEVLEDGFSADIEEGMEVLVAGRLNVYEPRGAYQLIAEFVQEEGVGELALKFEAMKAMLADKGYFDDDRKMALPHHPMRVAVVTAPGGAAVRDFLRLAGERGWGCEIRIYPSLVQGNRAPEQIATALDAACDDGWAEAVALIRGGGSLEDLWAFNTEPVADALFRATIPVVSGVGHEVDVTIADYVADARAATPSHAAQMLWPDRRMLMQQVDGLEQALLNAAGELLEDGERDLAHLEKALRWLSPAQRVARLEERHGAAVKDLHRAMAAMLTGFGGRLERTERALSGAFGPQAVERKLRMADEFAARLPRAAQAHLRDKDRVEPLARRLGRAADVWLREREQVLALAESRLDASDPEKPLERGYGLVKSLASGRFLRSVDEAAPGDELDIRVRDGNVAAQVTGVRRDD